MKSLCRKNRTYLWWDMHVWVTSGCTELGQNQNSDTHKEELSLLHTLFLVAAWVQLPDLISGLLPPTSPSSFRFPVMSIISHLDQHTPLPECQFSDCSIWSQGDTFMTRSKFHCMLSLFHLRPQVSHECTNS